MICSMKRSFFQLRYKTKTGCAHPDAPCQKPQTRMICTTGRSPSGTLCFSLLGSMMSLFRLPCSKFSLPFLAVPTGKDGRVECPCQTVNDFIGVRESVCGLFLFVQTHAPLIVPPWQSRARKSKFQFHIRRKGADSFRPALAAGGSLMAYKCLSLCDFFIVQHFFILCHIRFVLLEDF